jgi:hypothetical protein
VHRTPDTDMLDIVFAGASACRLADGLDQDAAG